jgi:hypothetical protein
MRIVAVHSMNARGKRGTKAQRHKGTEAQRHGGTEAQRHIPASPSATPRQGTKKERLIKIGTGDVEKPGVLVGRRIEGKDLRLIRRKSKGQAQVGIADFGFRIADCTVGGGYNRKSAGAPKKAGRPGGAQERGEGLRPSWKATGGPSGPLSCHPGQYRQGGYRRFLFLRGGWLMSTAACPTEDGRVLCKDVGKSGREPPLSGNERIVVGHQPSAFAGGSLTPLGLWVERRIGQSLRKKRIRRRRVRAQRR